MVRRGWFRWVAKDLFSQLYPDSDPTEFRFSASWFRGFLGRWCTTARFTTNRASQVPQNYLTLIINWMRFNRRDFDQDLQNLFTI